MRPCILKAINLSEPFYESPKLLRTSWTHVPDTRFITFILERLSACSALVMKVISGNGLSYMSIQVPITDACAVAGDL